jgi:hypothetical protein
LNIFVSLPSEKTKQENGQEKEEKIHYSTKGESKK